MNKSKTLIPKKSNFSFCLEVAVIYFWFAPISIGKNKKLYNNKLKRKEDNTYKKLILLTLLLIIPFTLSYAESILLKDYKPKNSDEEAIKNTLMSFVDAWKSNDKEGLLSCLSENAQWRNYKGQYLSKNELAKLNMKEYNSDPPPPI